MADSIKPGDRVSWESSQGKITGRVKKKLVKPTKIKTHEVAASPENPEFLVESEATGAEAAHKPEALHKVSAKSSDTAARAKPEPKARPKAKARTTTARKKAAPKRKGAADD